MYKSIGRLLLLICGVLYANYAHAQCYGCCQDSTKINTNSNCYNDYVPVCGCNGKTYHNSCFATDRDGILNYTAGPCTPMDFIIYPIPVFSNSNYGLTLSIAVQTTIDCQVYIMDVYGHQYYYYNVGTIDQNLPPYSYNVPIDNLNTGVYLIVVKTGTGYFKVKRFVKESL